MPIQTFSAPESSTIWDIVLNTYGTPDDIVKLMIDNNFSNVNTYPTKEQEFEFDDTLVINQNSLQSNLSEHKFATRERTTTNDTVMKYYEQNIETEYTSNSDGTTVIVIPELVGSERILYIEKEIKPISKNDYGFNSGSGTINLLNGETLDSGQTAYIIYVKIIQS